MNRYRDDEPEPDGPEPADEAAWSEVDRDRQDELEHWTPPTFDTWDYLVDPPPVPGEEHGPAIG